MAEAIFGVPLPSYGIPFPSHQGFSPDCASAATGKNAGVSAADAIPLNKPLRVNPFFILASLLMF
jgi:hypothetical protein